MPKPGTWKTTASEEKYKNPWITVTEDKVLDERGQEKTYGLVRMRPGSCILPMDNDGMVYLANQYRYGLGDLSIECPGGCMDEDDTEPLVTAKRELKEELGIIPEEWIPLGEVNALTSVITHTEYLFLAKGFEKPKVEPSTEEEIIELIKIPLEKAIEMAQNSEITHAPSVAVILRAARYLKK